MKMANTGSNASNTNLPSVGSSRIETAMSVLAINTT